MREERGKTVARLERIAAELRRDVVQMIGIGRAGHLGGSCSLAEIVAALFFHVMRFDPRDIRNPDRDRFVLSKGHAVLIQYAALVELGVIPREEIARTKTLEGMLQGHPDMDRTPGHRGGDRLSRPGTLHRRRDGARAETRPQDEPRVRDPGRRRAVRGAGVGGGHGSPRLRAGLPHGDPRPQRHPGHGADGRGASDPRRRGQVAELRVGASGPSTGTTSAASWTRWSGRPR